MNHATPPYSQSPIVRAEQRLSLSRKAASSTSNFAHLELDMHWRHLYLNTAFPDGILGESTRDIIDLDESKLKIEDQNHKFGKVVREKQCNTAGKYINGSQGVDLLMAISGNEQMIRHFHFTGVTQRELLICGSFIITLMNFATGWLSIGQVGYFYS
jgi:hypothetical protein